MTHLIDEQISTERIAANAEQRTMTGKPGADEPYDGAGFLRESAKDRYPTLYAYQKTVLGEGISEENMVTRERRDVARKQFYNDDGVSEYSRAWWSGEAMRSHGLKAAIGETLAEIAQGGIHKGDLPGTADWKSVFNMYVSQYKRLTGRSMFSGFAGGS